MWQVRNDAQQSGKNDAESCRRWPLAAATRVAIHATRAGARTDEKGEGVDVAKVEKAHNSGAEGAGREREPAGSDDPTKKRS